MRENRLAKLAEMKKMASVFLNAILRVWMAKIEDVKTTEELKSLQISYLSGKENSDLLIEDSRYNQRFQTALGEKEAALRKGAEEASKEKAKVSAGGLEAKTTKKFTDTIAHLNEYMAEMDKDSAMRYVNRQFDYSDFEKSLNEKEKAELDSRRSSIWDNYLSGAIKHVDGFYGRRGQSRSGIGPQATRDYTPLTADEGTKLEEVGRDGKRYVYTILTPSSFSYTVDDSASKTVNTTYSKWNDTAQKLNTLEVDRKNKAAAETPAPSPATTTAKTTAETPAPSSNQELEDKITRILLLAQSNPLNMGSLESEMKQITEMSNYLSPKGGLRALSRIIASIVGTNLGQLNAASLAEVAAATPADARVNKGGKFAVDTRIILKQINLLYRQRRGVLDSYFEPAAPATTTTPPSTDNADDGQNKSASLNKKFIKAATLRRLKIRSQMEAAIDSSAQMGRARVS